MKELFSYIFNETKEGNFRKLSLAMIKVACFFICLSPVCIYLILYQIDLFSGKSSLLLYILILGGGFILFFIIFMCSKIIAIISLIIKYKITNKSKRNEMKKYYKEYYLEEAF